MALMEEMRGVRVDRVLSSRKRRKRKNKNLGIEGKGKR
jgi:hypothetical protein